MLRCVWKSVTWGQNNSAAKPKQSLAFISLLIRLLRHSYALKKKKKKRRNPLSLSLTNTHTMHFHLIRLTYILMPYGQMIIEAHIREQESCGGVVLALCVCARAHPAREARRGNTLIQGERMNLKTWQEAGRL